MKKKLLVIGIIAALIISCCAIAKISTAQKNNEKKIVRENKDGIDENNQKAIDDLSKNERDESKQKEKVTDNEIKDFKGKNKIARSKKVVNNESKNFKGKSKTYKNEKATNNEIKEISRKNKNPENGKNGNLAKATETKSLDKNNKIDEKKPENEKAQGEDQTEKPENEKAQGEDNAEKPDPVDFIIRDKEIVGITREFEHELDKKREVDIPEGVTSIKDKVFEALYLRTIKLPNTLESIGEYAFSSNWLSKIELPSNLRKIGKGAFAYSNLTKVKLPESIETIEKDAFRYRKGNATVILTIQYNEKTKKFIEENIDRTDFELVVLGAPRGVLKKKEIILKSDTTIYGIRLGDRLEFELKGISQEPVVTLDGQEVPFIKEGNKIYISDYAKKINVEEDQIFKEQIFIFKVEDKEFEVRLEFFKPEEVRIEDKYNKNGRLILKLKGDGFEYKDIKLYTNEGPVEEKEFDFDDEDNEITLYSGFVDSIRKDNKLELFIEGEFHKRTRIEVELTPPKKDKLQFYYFDKGKFGSVIYLSNIVSNELFKAIKKEYNNRNLTIEVDSDSYIETLEYPEEMDTIGTYRIKFNNNSKTILLALLHPGSEVSFVYGDTVIEYKTDERNNLVLAKEEEEEEHNLEPAEEEKEEEHNLEPAEEEKEEEEKKEIILKNEPTAHGIRLGAELMFELKGISQEPVATVNGQEVPLDKIENTIFISNYKEKIVGTGQQIFVFKIEDKSFQVPVKFFEPEEVKIENEQEEYDYSQGLKLKLKRGLYEFQDIKVYKNKSTWMCEKGIVFKNDEIIIPKALVDKIKENNAVELFIEGRFHKRTPIKIKLNPESEKKLEFTLLEKGRRGTFIYLSNKLPDELFKEIKKEYELGNLSIEVDSTTCMQDINGDHWEVEPFKYAIQFYDDKTISLSLSDPSSEVYFEYGKNSVRYSVGEEHKLEPVEEEE